MTTDTMLADFLALNEAAGKIQGDIVSSGQQIRLVPGNETITPVAGLQTYFRVPDKIGLIRFQVRDQGGMPVVSMGVSFYGEEIGVIGPDDVRIPFSCYTDPYGATWRTWTHIANLEFMNPNMEFVDPVMEALANHGDYQNFSRPPQPGQEERVRKADVVFDVEPKGTGLQQRHIKGLSLSHVVITPDERIAPLMTSYEKDLEGGGKETIEQPGFTSFYDVLTHNIGVAMRAQTLPADAPNRVDIQKRAASQLSLLTGTDERTEERYSLRPTVGYFGLMAPEKNQGESDEAYTERLGGMNKFLAGEEMVLFPPRDTAMANSEAAASYDGANPFHNAGDEPINAIGGDEPDPSDS